MATVTCTLKYEGGKLTKVYQVQFDKTDTIHFLTETPGLAIKADNAHARNIFPALTNGNPQPPDIPPYEYVPPMAHANGGKPTPQCEITFTGSEENLARFLCGYRVDGKFEAYPVPDGPQIPNGN